jgi:catechol 2,3-dioxygenase-like lactoylglutathione lyase family enzyme
MASSDPQLVGVYETVLYASDVAAAARFYSEVLRLRVLEEPDELSAVFRLDDGGVLLVFDPGRASAPGRLVPSHGATGPGHVAFAAEAGSLEAFGRASRAGRRDRARDHVGRGWPLAVRARPRRELGRAHRRRGVADESTRRGKLVVQRKGGFATSPAHGGNRSRLRVPRATRTRLVPCLPVAGAG